MQICKETRNCLTSFVSTIAKFLSNRVIIGFVLAGILATPAAATPFLGSAADFVVLGLADGKVTINSATSITGNVGYSTGVNSTTNQKVDSFIGGAFVHSGATFSNAPDTFAPSAGIMIGVAADAKLNQANTDANAAATLIASLAPTHASLGIVVDDQNIVINTVGALNVIPVDSLKHKEDTFTINGGANDVFVFNVGGDWDYDNSQIVLNGVLADNVIFNFTTAAKILIGKDGTDFQGTILAPTGIVDYHNPANFDGRIIAFDIDLHSDFNIAVPTGSIQVPEPGALALFGAGLLGMILSRHRRAIQLNGGL